MHGFAPVERSEVDDMCSRTSRRRVEEVTTVRKEEGVVVHLRVAFLQICDRGRCASTGGDARNGSSEARGEKDDSLAVPRSAQWKGRVHIGKCANRSAARI